jgi:hypothetical protein
MYRLLREACSSGEASLALKRRDKLPALLDEARRGDDGGPGAAPASFQTAWEKAPLQILGRIEPSVMRAANLA